MTDDTLNPEEIRADMEAGTPGPWLYRPHEYTEWGDVYAGDFRICQARDPSTMSDDVLREHLRNNSDPWSAIARRIARVPDLEQGYLDTLPRAEAAEAERDRLREELRLTLVALEAWYKKSNPDWGGEAAPSSVIGSARAALTDTQEGRDT